EVLERERISIFAGSPTVFSGLMSHELFAAERVKGLRMSYSGSAPLPASLLAKWEAATGAPVLDGYGLSGAGPVVAFNPLNGPSKPQSVGQPLPCTTVEIVDVNDSERVLGAGERGEIRVRGPQLMRAYRNRPEESAEALRDGWLYTGDIGELDNDS